MLETVKTLCSLAGPSGWEDDVRDYILTKVLDKADSIDTDALGNLIVFKKGSKVPARKVMVCAHMDEVGLIVTSIEDDGYLRFDFLGGIDRRVIIGKRVFIGKSRVPGVIGIKAYHLVDKDEEKNVPKREDMYIDIGAKDADDAKKLVALGDFAVFDSDCMEFGDGFLKAKALDDRVGCAAMLKLIESDLPCDCSFVFTVQEEVGTRGAKVAANTVLPACAIILEGTTASDLPDVPESKIICRLGSGLVVPFMDKGTLYSRPLYKTVTETAEKNGIAWQTKTMIAGGTDASAVQRSGIGVDTIAISVPLRNIHSPSSIAKISDFEEMPRLAKLVLDALAAE
jgi:endoglucanase